MHTLIDANDAERQALMGAVSRYHSAKRDFEIAFSMFAACHGLPESAAYRDITDTAIAVEIPDGA